jgi:hypothetical protein
MEMVTFRTHFPFLRSLTKLMRKRGVLMRYPITGRKMA